MNEEKQVIKLDDIEVLNVNKELISLEKHNGFLIKKSNILMFLKELPANIYKLSILLLATVADLIPNFMAKVPILGYGVDFVKAYGESYVAQVGSDVFFDSIICPICGITVGNHDTYEYLKAYFEYTHHEGKYHQISMTIKAIATFVMEHPGLVLAGGATLAGFAYKVVSTIVKKVDKKVKFNRMNSKQQEVYLLLKDILKKARTIKKADNGDVLVNDLNITYEIVNHIGEYTDMLDRIHEILIRLQSAIENKNEVEYERCRLELETSVFVFDREHDNVLNEQMKLIESSKEVEDVDLGQK